MPTRDLYAGFAEQEQSFRLINPNDFPQVVEKLWPAGGLIDLDGITLARIGENITGSVHLFSSRTGDSTKERLRLSLDKRGLKCRLELKRSDDGAKYERLVKKTRGKKKIVRLLNEIQPVIATICKERATLVYKYIAIENGASVERHITVGIDRIVAVPADLTGRAFAFYDVDIEGDGSGSEVLFVHSRLFKSQFAKLLKPITPFTSKWRVATKASSEVKPWKYKSYDDVVDFYLKCVGNFKQIFPDGHLLDGPNHHKTARKKRHANRR